MSELNAAASLELEIGTGDALFTLTSINEQLDRLSQPRTTNSEGLAEFARRLDELQNTSVKSSAIVRNLESRVKELDAQLTTSNKLVETYQRKFEGLGNAAQSAGKATVSYRAAVDGLTHSAREASQFTADQVKALNLEEIARKKAALAAKEYQTSIVASVQAMKEQDAAELSSNTGRLAEATRVIKGRQKAEQEYTAWWAAELAKREQAETTWISGAANSLRAQEAAEQRMSAQRLAEATKLVKVRQQAEREYTAWWASEITKREQAESSWTKAGANSLRAQEAAERASSEKRLAESTRVVKARQKAEQEYTAWWLGELAKREQAEAALAIRSAELRSRMQKFSVERLDRNLIAPDAGTSDLARYYASTGAVRGGGSTLASINAAETARLAAAQLEASQSAKTLSREHETLSKAQHKVRETAHAAGEATHAATGKMGRYTEAQWEAHAAARGLAGSLGQLWMTYGALAPLLAGAAVGSALRSSITLGKEFEQQLTFVKALGGESAEAVERLAGAAKSLATEGLFGPTEIAGGLRILAQAGLDANQALLAIPQTLDLATVGEMKMEDAAITLVGVMNSFKLGIADVSHIGDVFAKAAAVSQVAVQDMTQSMRMASVAGEQYGASLEDTATALTLLGQINIKGTAAGTSFRNMLKELYTPGEAAAKVMKQLGLEVANAEGELRSFPDIIFDLKERIKDFDKTSQANILQRLFGERGAKEAIAMLSQTRAEWDKLRGSIADSGGFMRKVAAELEATTSGTLTQAFNTLKVTMIEVFDSTEGSVGRLALELKKAFGSDELKRSLSAIASGVLSLTETVIKLAPALGAAAAAWAAYKTAMIGVAVWRSVGAAIASVIGSVTALTGTLVAATGAMGPATAGLVGLRGAFAALGGPVTLIVSGLLAATAYLSNLAEKASDTELVKSTRNLADTFKSLADKTEESNRALMENLRLRRLGSQSDVDVAQGDLTSLKIQRDKLKENIRLSEEYAKSARGIAFGDIARPASVPFGLSELDVRKQELAKLEAEVSRAEQELTRAKAADKRATNLKMLSDLNAEADEYMKRRRLQAGERSLAAESTLADWKSKNDPQAAQLAALDAEYETIKKAWVGQADKLAEAKVEYDKRRAEIMKPKAISPENRATLQGLFTENMAEARQFITEQGSFNAELDKLREQDLLADNTYYAAKKAAAENYYSAAIASLKEDRSLFAGDPKKLAQIDAEIQKLETLRSRKATEIDTEAIRTKSTALAEIEAIEVASGTRRLNAVQQYNQKWLQENAATVEAWRLQLQQSEEGSEAWAEAQAALTRIFDAKAAGEWAVGIKQSLHDAADEFDVFTQKLERIGDKSAREGLFGFLNGTSAEFSRTNGQRIAALRKKLNEIQAELDKQPNAEIKASLIFDKQSLEEELRVAEDTVDPTLERWGDTFGDYMAEAIVYGFDQGESPAKAFGNFLKREMVKSLSQALSREFSVMMNVMMNGGQGAQGAAGQAQGGILGSLGGGNWLSTAQNAYGLYKNAGAAYDWATGSLYGGVGSNGMTSAAVYEGGQLVSGATYGASTMTSGALYNEAGQMVAAPVYEAGTSAGQATAQSWGQTAGQAAGAAFTAYNTYNAIKAKQWGRAAGNAIGYYFGGPIGAWIGGEIGGWVDKVASGGAGTPHSGAAVFAGPNGEVSPRSYAETQAQFANPLDANGFGQKDFYKRRSQDVADAIQPIATGMSSLINDTLKAFDIYTPYSVGLAFSSDRTDKSRGVFSLIDSEGEEVTDFSRKYDRKAEKAIPELTNDAAAVVRDLLVSKLPSWADDMLNSLGDKPTIDALEGMVAQIRTLQDVAEQVGPALGLAEEAFVGIVQRVGGDALNAYVTAFYSDAERIALSKEQLSKAFGNLDLEMPNTKDAFRDLVESIDTSTESGRDMYAALIALAPTFAQVAEAAALAGDALYSLSEEALAIFETLDSDIQKREADLSRAYSARKSELDGLISKFDSFGKSLRDFKSSLLTGDLSPLNPQEQYAETKARFEDVSRRAKLGDVDAIEQLQSVSSAFLKSSRDMYASGDAYNSDFASVIDALDSTESVAERQLRLQQESLDELKASVGELIDIDDGVGSLAERVSVAIQELKALLERPLNNDTGVTTQQISDLYRTELNRAPDQAGLDYWQKQAAGGMDFDLIRRSFELSPEAQIRDMYESLLNREPDAAGLSYWMGRVSNGMSLDLIRASIMASEEYQNLPKFADGGYHKGGLRLVGERGPEIEATGPSRIWTYDQMREVFSGGGNDQALIAELRQLRSEVSELRAEQRAQHREAVATNYDANERNANQLAETWRRTARQDNAARKYA